MVAFSLKDAAPAQVRPLKRYEYDALVAMGTFDGERVELIRGVILTVAPSDPPHGNCIESLTQLLFGALAGRARLRVQLPLSATDDSVPEPDFAVVATPTAPREHPRTALLVIEVAASSLKHDRGVKADIYAQAGVGDYWIVNLVDDQIEVLRDVVVGRYRSETIYRRGERVALLAFPDVAIAVDDILPPR
jgi:Uma2 family endonuclease